MLIPSTLHTRRGEDGGSKETTVVIAVVASLGGIILIAVAFALYRVISRRASKPPPFPPAQPLAHQREQQISQFHTSLSSDSTLLSPGYYSSNVFNGQEKDIPTSPSTPSYHSDFTGETAEDATMSMQPLAPGADLPTPNPRFTVSNESTSSMRTNTSSPDYRQSSGNTSPSSTRSTSRRPHSMQPPNMHRVSTTSINTSTTRSSRWGLPHDPHSGVQIILPAPLSHSQAQLSVSNNANRYSVADPWASAALGPDSSYAHSGSSRSLRVDSRLSVASASLTPPSIRGRSSNLSMYSSGPSQSVGPSPSSTTSLPLVEEPPPVPRIPSIYSSYQPPMA